jgi:hypothetical protein
MPYWVFRDWFSKNILMATQAFFRTQTSLLHDIWKLRHAMNVPIVGIVHDGNEYVETVVRRFSFDERCNLAYSLNVLPSQDDVEAFFDLVIPSGDKPRAGRRDIRFPPRYELLWKAEDDSAIL